MKERSYEKLVDRMKSIKYDYSNLYELGETEYGSIFYFCLKSKSENPIKVLISAGIHGDEPAGVEAVMKFLENDNSALLEKFEFLVMPCLNPYGYNHDVRWNSDGVDINRTFENNLSMEALLVKILLAEKQFDLFIEFHEDWEYRGFYLFEIAKCNKAIGKEIINNIEQIGEIKKDEIIDGFINNQGVISIDCEEFENNIMALYLANNHVKHSLTLETPMQWTLDSRINAHLSSLSVALNSYLIQEITSSALSDLSTK